MRRIASLFVGSLFIMIALVELAPRVSAQERDTLDPTGLLKEIRQRLNAKQPKWVAWGAYQASELKVKAAIPDLRARLVALNEEARADATRRAKAAAEARGKNARNPRRRVVRFAPRRAVPEPTSPFHGDYALARLAILDALARTGGSLPSDQLLAALSGETAGAVIAIADNDIARGESVLVHLLTDETWRGMRYLRRVAGDVLVKHRSKRLFAAMLSDVGVTTEVQIGNGRPDHFRQRNQRRMFRGTVRPFRIPKINVPKGFPPIAYYVPSRDMRLMGDGRQELLLTRRVAESLGRVYVDVRLGGFQWHHVLDRWAALLLGTKPDNLPFRFRERTKMNYISDLDYRQRILRLAAMRKGQFEAMVNRLRKAGLAKGEIRFTPQITVLDRRGANFDLLPEIDEVEVR